MNIVFHPTEYDLLTFSYCQSMYGRGFGRLQQSLPQSFLKWCLSFLPFMLYLLTLFGSKKYQHLIWTVVLLQESRMTSLELYKKLISSCTFMTLFSSLSLFSMHWCSGTVSCQCQDCYSFIFWYLRELFAPSYISQVFWPSKIKHVEMLKNFYVAVWGR